MTSYEAIYGGSEFLIPRYNPAGYQEIAGNLGMSTDPRTANQLKEINVKLNPGVKHMEVGGIQSAVFDSIPEEHLDEIRRLSKLTGVTTSVHAPIVEASGIGERGWDESNRLGAEKQIESALIRSNRIDPNGNISVTVHSTAQLPEMEPTIKIKNPQTGEEEIKRLNQLWIVNPETGKYTLLQPEKRFFPEEGVGKFEGEKVTEFNPQKELDKRNYDEWTEKLSNVNRMAVYGDDILKRVKEHFGLTSDELFSYVAQEENAKKFLDEDDREMAKNAQKEIVHGQIYLRDSYRQLKDMFDKAWVAAKSADNEKDMGKLREFADKYAKDISPGIESDMGKTSKIGEIVEEGLKVLRVIEKPKEWMPLQEFALKKSAETFANASTAAWEKYKDKAPILNIENPPAGGGLSTAEDLKKLVQESRKKFVENLVNKGIDKNQAEESAEKLIGATWDVGHINMLRKKGFTEKDVIEQSKIIAPFVKHVHLSDNFGLEHTELPMGMGNVPIKEIMDNLKKKGFKGKEVIEAGNWWQYFAEQGGGNPFRPTIQNFDSPIYAMKEGYSWSQLGSYPGYYSGHGPVNPQVHHTVYGSGFQNLPVELGGEIPGSRDRMSGTPMQ